MATNKQLVQSLYAAFAHGDVPAVLGAFHPRIEWNEAEDFLYADGNPYVGPATVAEGVFQRIGRDVQNFSVTPERYHDAGDTVVVEGRYRGTMAATDRPVNAQFVHVWHWRDGKVVRFQQYTDTHQWRAAAG